MNVDLKAIVNVICDAINIGEDVAGKHWMQIIGAVIGLFKDLPAVSQNISDLKAEILALPANTAAQQDLISYIETRVAGIANAQAQSILGSALDLVSGVLAVIEKAILLKALI